VKTLKLLAWTWVFAVFVSLLSGCDDPTDPGGSATSAQSVKGPASISHSATLSWEAPTANTNGTALTDLAGYRIMYGSSASELSQTVHITGVGIQTYVIDNLAPGTWYFAVMAVTSTGEQSALSDIASKTIG
jgi:Fibronectin type III domain